MGSGRFPRIVVRPVSGREGTLLVPSPDATTAVSAPTASARRRSAWPVLLAALCLSLPLHLALALWLSGVLVQRPQRVQQAVLIEAAGAGGAEQAPEQPEAAPTQQFTPPVPLSAAVPSPDARWQAPEVDGGAVLDAARPQAQAFVDGAAAPGSAAIGGGAGSGFAGTTFFGTRATGKRFAFIVDKSGSMANDGKMERAMRELARSVEALPDFAQFRVLLFDAQAVAFPDRGFTKARESEVVRLGRWLGDKVPSGGTTPEVAFDCVMNDPTPPDAIFFMTDGEIGRDDPAKIVRSVSRGGGIVPVHCIAFGDTRAAAQLAEIARATGGQYRFVPLEAGR